MLILALTHFAERLKNDLPQVAPFNCPLGNCKSNFRNLNSLINHYSLSHKMVFKLLNEQAGIMDSDDIAIVKQFEMQKSN